MTTLEELHEAVRTATFGPEEGWGVATTPDARIAFEARIPQSGPTRSSRRPLTAVNRTTRCATNGRLNLLVGRSS